MRQASLGCELGVPSQALIYIVKEMRHHKIRLYGLFLKPLIRDIVLDFGHVVKTTSSEERGIAMLGGIITTALHDVSIGPV